MCKKKWFTATPISICYIVIAELPVVPALPNCISALQKSVSALPNCISALPNCFSALPNSVSARSNLLKLFETGGDIVGIARELPGTAWNCRELLETLR